MIDTVSYGKALYQLAEETRNEVQVREQLELIRTVLTDNPAYVTLLDTPAVATEEKLSLLREAFDGMDSMLLNFLSILCEKRAICDFSVCADAFDRCFDEARGIVRATAITALPMTEKQLDALREKLALITGKTIALENRTDPELIGGIKLRCGGVQLDGSIQSRLDRLRRSLSETIV